MEIQNGKGPWASPISGIVPLGSTLTMVVAINDLAGKFYSFFHDFHLTWPTIQSLYKRVGSF
jgi:hypothetical protein